ncbi:MAG: AtpZ/AtpI family protein [Hyphomicrobiaceae bacterium]
MTTSPDDDRTYLELSDAVQHRKRRDSEWLRSGERPLWRNLSMIGALGWLIVLPTLLGALTGGWLDRKFDSGIFWSGALIVIGAALGGYLAWRRMHIE